MSESKLFDLTGQDRTLAEYHSALDQNLKSGGGGGTFDDMEPRIARLEAHMEHVLSDLTDVRRDMGTIVADGSSVKERLARLEEKVEHLPSKGFIITALGAMLALIAALVGYQEQIKALLA